MSRPLRPLMGVYPTQDGLVVYLRGQGYFGAINDMSFNFLGNEGYTGTLSDRLDEYNTDFPDGSLPGGGVGGTTDILLETGDRILLETGDALILE